jgi:hypothetical protein
VNARLESRLLAMGVCDSIAHCTGRAPVPHKPRIRIAAYVGGYALLLFVVGAVLALAAR